MNFTFELNSDYSFMGDIIADLPNRLDEVGEVIYKGRNEVQRIKCNGQQFVVKRYKSLGLFKGVIYTFFKSSKAYRAYYNALKLSQMGISTPKQIAYCHVKEGVLIKDCYFVSVEDMGQSCVEVQRESENRDEIIEKLAAFFVKMHKCGFLHGDANLSNFLYAKNAQTGTIEISTIDTNRSSFSNGELSQKECLKNFSRLSHDRGVVSLIVRVYARLRGWDETYCEQQVFNYIGQFEKRKIFLYKLRGRKLPDWA